MTISNTSRIILLALALAIPAEGLRQYAYTDPVGILTVCYGHIGNDIIKGKKYSLEECKSLISADMQEAVDIVDKCHPNLPDKVRASFSDAVFNIGGTVACNSTASKYLSQGKYKEACNELPKWNKARVAGQLVELKGLTKRREAEREVCLSDLS